MPNIKNALSNYGKNVAGGAKIVGKAVQKGAIRLFDDAFGSPMQNQKNINKAKKATAPLMGRPSAGMIKKMGFKK